MYKRLFDDRNETRREFIATAAAGLAATVASRPSLASDQNDARGSLAGAIGLTTGGLNYQRRRGKLTLLGLPRFVRDELGLAIIDLNTHWLEGYEPSYLAQVRGTAEEFGCFFTNLKVNHQFGDLYSRDPHERQRALAGARRLIEVAKLLGTRWIRFTFPGLEVLGTPPNPVAHRDLAGYAEQHGIQLLVENLGWLTRDANSVPRLVASIGRNIAPCPDTGNWADEIRYEGLARTFPTAVTCAATLNC